MAIWKSFYEIIDNTLHLCIYLTSNSIHVNDVGLIQELPNRLFKQGGGSPRDASLTTQAFPLQASSRLARFYLQVQRTLIHPVLRIKLRLNSLKTCGLNLTFLPPENCPPPTDLNQSSPTNPTQFDKPSGLPVPSSRIQPFSVPHSTFRKWSLYLY